MTQTIPTVFVRALAGDRIAVRFASVGNRWRFNTILQRLRFDFPLINYVEIEGQPWWVVTQSQYDEIVAFAGRNGLRLVELGTDPVEAVRRP